MTKTGLGGKLAGGILDLALGNFFLVLLFTMIACIILGMGLPTTANYVVTATVAAPIFGAVRRTSYSGPLLRLLLRHRGGHYAAGLPRGLRGGGHSRGEPDDYRRNGRQAGDSGVYHPVHFCHQPGAVIGRRDGGDFDPGCGYGP